VQLRNGLFVLAVFVGLNAAAFGQDTATLKWKFTEKTPFYQKMTTDTEQTMKVMGTDVKQKQTQTFYFQWTPLEKQGEGWVIEQKIIGVKMTIDIGGNKVEYDSTKDQAGANPLADFFKALVNSSFKLTVDKDGTVTKIEGRKEFVDNLVKANSAMKPLLEQILSDKALQEMAGPTFAVATIGGREVKKGDDKLGKWQKVTNLDMGPIGSYKNTFDYTYEGPDSNNKNLQKVKVETKLEYTPPKADVAGNTLPFKIKSASLTSKNAGGTIIFDTEAGRITSSDAKLELSGDLEIEISGQTTKVNLTQTQNTKTETSDKEFPELKKAS
jgi:hypothetical protein